MTRRLPPSLLHYGFLLIYIICGGTRRRRAFVRNTVYIYIYIIIHHSLLLLLRFQSTQRRSSFLFVQRLLWPMDYETHQAHTHKLHATLQVRPRLPSRPALGLHTTPQARQGKATSNCFPAQGAKKKLFTTTSYYYVYIEMANR